MENRKPIEEIEKKAGISRATFYRQKKNYKCWGIIGLKELSRRPHRTMEKSALTSDAMAVLRKAGIMLSESSIGRALSHFIESL